MVHRLALPGYIALMRTRYARTDGSSVVPVDALVDQAQRTISLGVGQLACRLALDAHSFQRAAANLQAAAHLVLSDETLRQLVEHEGQLVVAAQTYEQLEFDWQARECLTPGTDGQPVSRVYFSCDGVLVPAVTQAEKVKRRTQAVERRKHLKQRRLRPLPPRKSGADQGFKEFKIAICYDQPREHWAVCATRRDHRHAGRLMRRLAAAVGMSQAQEAVGLIDGAVWIASQTRAKVPDLDQLTLDFHHLSGHVHQVRAEVFGEQAAQGWDWIQEVLHTIKHEGYEAFWDNLQDLRSTCRSRTKRQIIDGLLQYVAARKDMLDYPQHLQQGWDIGSGPMESMCKALTRRLKGRGMRWDLDNAEAMMAMESLMQSRQWSRWWDKRLLCNN